MKIKRFNVTPYLPEKLKPLRAIAMNIWSTWNWQAAQLFIRLDSETWEKCQQNLVRTLAAVPQELLDAAAEDDSFVANLKRVEADLKSYLEMPTWYSSHFRKSEGLNHPSASDTPEPLIGYFSMEYGLDVGLPIYSGGLGILSGDHFKSASDLGIPIIGVGLLYQKGYFKQSLTADGHQIDHYPVNDWYNMPVTLERRPNGDPIRIMVELDGERVFAHIWRVDVGRVPLYLLDANIPDNPPEIRGITAQLYGGDRDNRIRQEILLGIGGVRALGALGLKPTVYHMNEGHSAFLLLERIANNIERGLTFKEAREVVFATSVFTLHTPIPAGNEVFGLFSMEKYFKSYAARLGMSWEEFLQIGREPGRNDVFSMTALALNLSAFANGVSQLHGVVARKMWQGFWPELPEREIPIIHITNGIHARTWISYDLDDMMKRYIGPQWVDEPANLDMWKRVDSVPDSELWRIHQIRKERLIFFTRKRVKKQLENRQAGMAQIEEAGELLTSDALTIGFARRFATYKRATMLLRDPDRFKKMLLDPIRPIQIIFSGKAHPHDEAGKEFIREITRFASDPEIRRRFVFIEDYDMNVARYMVQGVDIWLANPLRPMEASATSGMKAAANGVLNISTLDGWWDEAYSPKVGWAIGSRQTDPDNEVQEQIDSEALYNLLEREIIPEFFDADATRVPRRWLAKMKNSMKELGRFFNTNRMVLEYFNKFYYPAHKARLRLKNNGAAKAKALSAWRERINQRWAGVKMLSRSMGENNDIPSGGELPVRVEAFLNGLQPAEVAVELLVGPVDENDRLIGEDIIPLRFVEEIDDNAVYEAVIPCRRSGRHGYAVRIRPNHPDAVHPFTPFKMTWE